MGSQRPRNSTRARKVRSAKSLPRPRRKPALKMSGEFRRAAERFRVQRSPEPMAARLDPPRADKLSPVTALRKILAQLEHICSTAIVVHHALREQAVELDDDAADVLRLHVSDPLYDQILKLKRIAGGGAS